MTRWQLVHVLVATALLGGGCSGLGPSDGGDGGVSSDGDADDRPDADSSGDGGSDARLDRVGLVAFTQPGSLDPEASVDFRNRLASCGVVEQSFGECTARTSTSAECPGGCARGEYCRWSEDCSSSECVALADIPRSLPAGVVTITGASYGDPATCSPPPADASPFDGYSCDLPATIWWSEGDILAVAAPGGAGFPAFALDVVAPARMQLVTDTSDWTLGTFHGDGDVPVQWQPGSGDQVLVTVRSFTTSRLECLTADDGQFVLPAAGLGAIARTGDRIVVTVGRVNRAAILEGADGEVVLTASSTARVRVE